MKQFGSRLALVACVVLGAGAAQAQVVVQGSQRNVARQPPPAPQVEVTPPSPGRGYVWTGGAWQWNGDRHVWSSGRWQQPPAANQFWVAGHWTQARGAWNYVPGTWRGSMDARVAPPPQMQEQVPAAPSPDHRWVPGNWMWNGSRHFWVAGHWEMHQGSASWEPGAWRLRGRTHAWVPGRWR